MAYDEEQEEIILKVRTLAADDSDRGVCRVTTDVYDALGIHEGQYLLLDGKDDQKVLLLSSMSEGKGKNILIDAATRRYLHLRVGQTVTAAKTGDLTVLQEVEVKTLVHNSQFLLDHENWLVEELVERGVVLNQILELVSEDRRLTFEVVKLTPEVPFGIIDENTEIVINAEADELINQWIPNHDHNAKIGLGFADIGGLEKELLQLREIVELPLLHPEVFEQLGVDPPRGVLLTGPPGTGKTLMARAIANESNATFFLVNGPEFLSHYYGQSESNLRKIFEEAEKSAPSIIFLDELDSIAPNRANTSGFDSDNRIVSVLLTCMDGLKKSGRVIVIAASNRQNAIDPALRRGGRFEREIQVGVPNKSARKDILNVLARNVKTINVDFEELSEITHGFVGADLAQLVREAAFKAIQRQIPNIFARKEKLTIEELDKLKIDKIDFEAAMNVVLPSAMREFFIEIPKVTWNEVGGYTEIKTALKNNIELPLKAGKLFSHFNVQRAKGILLVGAPGTGKTLFAKAVANSAAANFISIKGPELLSKWVGESERGIREVFRQARRASPCIIFFDEIDSIALKRAAFNSDYLIPILSQFLTELDGIEKQKDVVVLAATNRIDLIDPALLRPGRLDLILYMNLPTEQERVEIAAIHLRDRPVAPNVTAKEIATQTPNMSGADIAAVCNEAAMLALRRTNGNVADWAHANLDAEVITLEDVKEAILNVKKRIKSQTSPAGPDFV